MLITVVGNRPQFVKLAPVAHEIRRRSLPSLTVHSGQHFDASMSDVFFDELGIPPPDIQLVVQGRTHARATGEMMAAIEDVLLERRPTGVLVYGDTNTTLAAALAAVKLCLPIAHVEAGPRIYDMRSPEEINRIVADHSSSLRFCPDAASVENLRRENITSGVIETGDAMYDAFEHFRPIARTASRVLDQHGLRDTPFTLLTAHRPNNTDSDVAIARLVELCEAIDGPVLFPVHPRTKAALDRAGLWNALASLAHVRAVPPLGYLDVVAALDGCARVVTDSGGLQKEAFFARKPAIVLFAVSPWPALVDDGWVRPMGSLDETLPADILPAIAAARPARTAGAHFGDGRAATRIVDALEQHGFFGV